MELDPTMNTANYLTTGQQRTADMHLGTAIDASVACNFGQSSNSALVVFFFFVVVLLLVVVVVVLVLLFVVVLFSSSSQKGVSERAAEDKRLAALYQSEI